MARQSRSPGGSAHRVVSPVVRDDARSTRDAVLVLVIIGISTVFAFGHGVAQAPGAAEADAAAAEWSWGSTAFIGQWLSAVTTFAGALVIGLVAALALALATSRVPWRRTALAALVAVTVTSTVVGFVVGYGAAGEGSPGIAGALGVTIGALTGYAIGRAVVGADRRRAAQPTGHGRPGRADRA